MLNWFGPAVSLSQHIMDFCGSSVLEGNSACFTKGSDFSTFKHTFVFKFFG